MRTLASVLDEAAERSGFEVVLESSRPIAYTTARGREFESRALSALELFEMLSAIVSDDQQVELAIGNPVVLSLEAGAVAWTVLAEPRTAGMFVRASCPELAAAARTHAAAGQDGAEPSEADAELFDDVWRQRAGESFSGEDGAPVFIAATDSAVQGLPGSEDSGSGSISTVLGKVEDGPSLEERLIRYTAGWGVRIVAQTEVIVRLRQDLDVCIREITRQRKVIAALQARVETIEALSAGETIEPSADEAAAD